MMVPGVGVLIGGDMFLVDGRRRVAWGLGFVKGVEEVCCGGVVRVEGGC